MEEQLKRTVSGVKWSSLSSLSIAVIQFVTIILLASFLQKNELGQIAIIQTVVGITIIFLDIGIGNAVVYKRNITKEQLSSVYWVNVVSGAFFSIVIFFSASFIAAFYESTELVYAIKIVSISFFILSLSRLYKFLFIKYLHLKEVALSEILSYSIAFIVMLILLYLDYKVLAFVYSIIVRAVIQSSYLFFKGISLFIPSKIYNHKSLEELLRYGAFNLGENITDYFNAQLDTILIGKLLGLEVLGVYSIAKTLASKPLQLIAPVLSKVNFPLMAKEQANPKKLKEFYIISIKYLFTVVLVIYITMAFEASDLIHIIYRDKWVEAISILQLLTIMYAIKAIRNPMGSLILASGKVNWRFYWNISMLFIIPILIYVASFYGIHTIVLSLIIFYIIAFYVSFKLITQKILNISFKELVFPILHILSLMVPSIISMFILRELIDNMYIRIIIISIVSLALYIIAIYKFNNSFFEEVKQNIFKKKEESVKKE